MTEIRKVTNKVVSDMDLKASAKSMFSIGILSKKS
jgi:hypothetical protein